MGVFWWSEGVLGVPGGLRRRYGVVFGCFEGFSGALLGVKRGFTPDPDLDEFMNDSKFGDVSGPLLGDQGGFRWFMVTF